MSQDQAIDLSYVADLFEDSFRSLKPTKLSQIILAECREDGAAVEAVEEGALHD